ncbi:MAG: zinc ribbon domain-containing protein [Candidatus Neomarinimicrobiota bacterium]
MPIYDYRCRACGSTFSALVASSDTPEEEVVCPRCKERQAKKLLSMKTVVISKANTTASSASCNAPAGSGFT